MLDQNTDRGSWAMIALVVAGVALLLVKAGSNEIGALILDNIKALLQVCQLPYFFQVQLR